MCRDVVAVATYIVFLSGCTGSEPSCDGAEVISAVIADIERQNVAGVPHITAADEVDAESKGKMGKCTIDANERLRRRLRETFGEAVQNSDLATVTLETPGFCDQLKTASKVAAAKDKCSNLFLDAINNDNQVCQLKIVDDNGKKLEALYRTTKYEVDSIRFKGKRDQSTAVACAAVLHISIPNYGASTRDFGYTVEHTTDGKPFVKVEDLTSLRTKP